MPCSCNRLATSVCDHAPLALSPAKPFEQLLADARLHLQRHDARDRMPFRGRPLAVAFGVSRLRRQHAERRVAPFATPLGPCSDHVRSRSECPGHRAKGLYKGRLFRTFGSYCVLGVRRGSCVAEIVVKVNRKTLLLASSFLALFALACSYGVGVGRYRLSPYAQVRALGNSFRTIAGETETKLYGRWGRARASRGLASDDEETLNRLSALGYLRGYTPAENAGGVTVLEAGSVEDGLTLFTSGHAPVRTLFP